MESIILSQAYYPVMKEIFNYLDCANIAKYYDVSEGFKHYLQKWLFN